MISAAADESIVTASPTPAANEVADRSCRTAAVRALLNSPLSLSNSSYPKQVVRAARYITRARTKAIMSRCSMRRRSRRDTDILRSLASNIAGGGGRPARDQRAPRDPPLFEDPQVAVLLCLSTPRRRDVQRLQPHLSP